MEKNKKNRITVKELRKFKGLEDISDKEAEAMIETLEKMSILLCELFMKRKELMD